MADDSVESLIGLFLHLFFVFLFIAGLGIATTLRFAAGFGGYQKPSEVASLLALVRPLVPVVVLSLTIAMCFGFWTAHSMEHNLSGDWLIVTYVLVGYMFLVGAVAGRHDRQTREMAIKEAADKTDPSAEVGFTIGIQDNEKKISVELERRLRSPLPLALNLSMIAAVMVVLGMMVFRPGAIESSESDESSR